jgi:hypothetical protein
VQPLENSGGLTAYGPFIALGLVAFWAVLLIPVSRGRLEEGPFRTASYFLGLLAGFFCLWPYITEISFGKLGSIKTNVEQARAYLSQIKAIEGEVKDVKARIKVDTQRAQDQQSKLIAVESIIMPRRWYGPYTPSIVGAPTTTAVFRNIKISSELFKYPKTKTLIRFASGTEPEQLAIMISTGLKAAGWDPEPPTVAQSGIPDGVQLWTRPDHNIAWSAAEALAASLVSEGIEAETPQAKLHRDDPGVVLLSPDDIRRSPPAGTVVILIGERPGFLQLLGFRGEEYRAAHPNEK